MKRLLGCILIGLTLLAGCYSAVELNDMMIATGIGVDWVDNQFELTLQVLNPGEIAGGEEKTSRTPVTNYHAKGDTMFEAMRRLTTTTPRKIFVGHIQVLIFGEKLAREKGVAETLDFIIRDHEFRSDFIIAVAKENKAKNVLSILTPMEQISAQKIQSNLEASEDFWGATRSVKLNEFVQSLVSQTKDPILSNVKLEGNLEEGRQQDNVEKLDPAAILQVDKVGIFNGDRLVKWFDEEESKGFNYLTGHVHNTVETIEYNGGTITFEIVDYDANFNSRYNDDELIIDVEAETIVNIGDVETEVSLDDQAVLKEIEDKLAERIEDLMSKCVEEAKIYQADIFGFGIQTRRDLPHLYEERFKEEWYEYFLTCDVQYDVDVMIRHGGMITDSLYDQMKD
ncbi:spore germination protein KC [Pelagirhabdus alkalitolerans]|uniref:Spore germination protein KC n=1 Tax=Pelagirhabdus alkalitolerans TaxID=1612202 RepID=A0A1G6N5F9_9BACI|nr:Ger(x)C family spore germination protein [Pelagirhabdus alkalitolerans]SDC63060.1 spore germination protein KC [Pelagirhabdus alkalitolerans]